MPLPITFGPLTTAPLNDLDEMFSVVGLLGVIPCSVTGMDALVLTPTASPATPSVLAYQNYMAFAGIAVSANTSGVTAQAAGLATLPVYKDTGAGPVGLATGDIQPNNLIVLYYDSSLNSGGGGFHLYTAPAATAGTVTQIVAGTGLSGGTITAAGTISTAQIPTSRIMANVSGGNASPSAQTLSVVFDAMIGSVQYGYPQRGASSWAEIGGLSPAVSAAGSNQGSATALTAQFNAVTTVGSGQGVILAATLALAQTVWNRGLNSLLVYPPSGAQIDGLGTNNPATISTLSYGTYVMTSTIQGYTAT